MSLGVEVRKDLVWRFDEAGHPEEPDAERALFVADRIADAVLREINDRIATGRARDSR